MVEIEKTYLIKYIPEGLLSCKNKQVIDIYIPESQEHPNLRIRKNGDLYEMTKKIPVKEGDASYHHEHTIPLTKEEFEILSKVPGKKVSKIRYYYDYKGHTSEIDVFQDDLGGLILVDFEFNSVEDKDRFELPDFCLFDVTQEKFLAGGMLCGKSFDDIKNQLIKFNYQKK